MPTYSSTANFDLSIDEIAEEAYERCGLQVRSGYDLKTARRSLNLMLSEWANRGLNLWTIQLQEKSLPAGTTNLTGLDLFGSGQEAGQQIVDITDLVIRDSSNNDFSAQTISRSTYYALIRMKDAGAYTNNAEIPFRFLPCMTAGLAYYIAMKKAPERIQLLKQVYEDEFQRAAAQDGERTSLFLTPKTYLPGV
jgi:hypothetical protein